MGEVKMSLRDKRKQYFNNHPYVYDEKDVIEAVQELKTHWDCWTRIHECTKTCKHVHKFWNQIKNESFKDLTYSRRLKNTLTRYKLWLIDEVLGI